MANTTTETTETKKPAYSRKTLKKKGREKRKAKIIADPAFKKAFFEAKSKRSTDKKSAFRKSKTKKA